MHIALPQGSPKRCRRLELSYEMHPDRRVGKLADWVAGLSPLDDRGVIAGTLTGLTGTVLRAAPGRWGTGPDPGLSGYIARSALRDVFRQRIYTAIVFWSEGDEKRCGTEQYARVRSATREIVRSFAVSLTSEATDPPTNILSAPLPATLSTTVPRAVSPTP